MTSDRYVAPLRFQWLTRLYDPLIGRLLPEARFKRALIEQAGIPAGAQILDLGCGTGTLTLEIKGTHPDATVWGVDADSKALKLAKAKAAARETPIALYKGLAQKLPLPDASFDRVLSSLFFHHLDSAAKSAALAEVRRVLKPGGELHVADWGKARNGLMRLAFLPVQLLDGFPQTRDNVAGRLPEFIAQAGFEEAAETASYDTVFGTLSLYRARKPVAHGGAS